jgi:hypothetical protein
MAKIVGKKCIPGLFCVDNMTLFLFMILSLFILFLVFRISNANNVNISENKISEIRTGKIFPIACSSNYPVTGLTPDIRRTNDPLTNPYIPPEKNSIAIKPVATQPYNIQYTQVGILTRKKSEDKNQTSDILPLMGRRQITSRDKWQYYTLSGGGNGNFQTKLPIRVNGKSSSGEYGCDEIYTNDVVYVEGYKEMFQATIYENNMFNYIP